MQTLCIILLAVVTSFLVACGGGEADNTISAEYESAKEEWAVSGSANYRFTLSRSCFCTFEEPVDVTVRGGQIQSATLRSSGAAIASTQLKSIPTLSGMFVLAETTYAQNSSGVTFRVNGEYGFLEFLNLDPYAQGIDDEIAYTVTNFVVDA